MKDYKKRLVYILHSIEVGGAEVALLSAIPGLAEEYDLKIVVLGRINESLIAHLSVEQKKVFQVFAYPVYLYPLLINNIVKFVLKFDPHYLICSLWRASWMGSIVKKRNNNIKLFVFIHSVKFFHQADEFFTARAVKMADQVFADSSSSHDFIQSRFRLDCPVRIVSFLTHITPAYQERIKLQGKAEIKMMTLGRLDKVKNLPLSVKVVSHLREKGYNVTLDVFGRWDNAYEETVTAISNYKLEEFVRLKGEVSPSAKFALFKDYDFYIQLSAFEGMAMSVAEAMQNGLPCIVSPVGEIPNYSRDMESAVFLDIWDAAKWEPSLRKIEEVFDSAELYANISKNCWSNFKEKPVFVDSLIDCVEN